MASSALLVPQSRVAITGAIESITVTVAEQVSVLPTVSVTVNKTGLPPSSAQVNAVWLATSETVPQASLLPLSISPAAMLAIPAPSKWMLMSWQSAFGGTGSTLRIFGVDITVAPQP